MVTVNNNVTTIEYNQKTQNVNGSQQTVSEKTVPVGQNSDAEKNTLDEKLNKIINQYNNFKLEDAKKLLLEICGKNEEQLSQLSENELNKILSCLEEALKQCSHQNKVNTGKLSRRFQAYNVMVIKGSNTIEEANKSIEEFKNRSLTDVLYKRGYLDKNVPFNEISDEELKNALAKFLNDGASHIKDPSKLTQKDIEKQQKIVERLLANSSDEEKTRLWNVFKDIVANKNICPAFQSMLASYIDKDKLVEFLKSIKPADLVKSGMPNEDVQKFEHLVSANLDEKGLEAHSKEIMDLIVTLQKANAPLEASIREKKQKALETGEPAVFTEEEQAYLDAKERYNFLHAGGISGTADNKNVSEECKTDLIQQYIEAAKQNGTYEEVIGIVKEFAQQNSELMNTKPDEFEKFMNSLTNDEYQTIKTPTEKKIDAAKTADVGFPSREKPDEARVEALKAQYIQPTEKAEFKVYTPETTNPIISNHESFLDKIKKAKTREERLELVNEYLSKSPVLKNKIVNMLLSANQPVMALNGFVTSESDRFALAYSLMSKGHLKAKDIDALILSSTYKSILKHDFDKFAPTTAKDE